MKPDAVCEAAIEGFAKSSTATGGGSHEDNCSILRRKGMAPQVGLGTA
jgi:hypothetical protein